MFPLNGTVCPPNSGRRPKAPGNARRIPAQLLRRRRALHGAVQRADYRGGELWPTPNIPIWFGAFLPAKTPCDIVDRLHRATLKNGNQHICGSNLPSSRSIRWPCRRRSSMRWLQRRLPSMQRWSKWPAASLSDGATREFHRERGGILKGSKTELSGPARAYGPLLIYRRAGSEVTLLPESCPISTALIAGLATSLVSSRRCQCHTKHSRCSSVSVQQSSRVPGSALSGSDEVRIVPGHADNRQETCARLACWRASSSAVRARRCSYCLGRSPAGVVAGFPSRLQATQRFASP